MGLTLTPPRADQVEVTLIGPGYGESCLIHLGDGAWVIVDSCVDAQDRPCAIQYLKQIGVQPEISVRLIIATHWHDDHIRGLAETLRVCSRAAFCCSTALKKEEFLATVTPYNENINFSGGSGVAEIIDVMKLLKDEQRRPIARAHVDRRVLHFPSDK